MRVVYFIHNEALNAVKIGYADDLDKRLRALQTANASPLVVLGTLAFASGLEAALHRKYRAERIRGEWFRVSVDDVLQLIERLSSVSPEEFAEALNDTPFSLFESGMVVSVGVQAVRRRGRPTIPEAERRVHRLDDVRFTAAELQRAKDAAARAGVPWSTWLRERVLLGL